MSQATENPTLALPKARTGINGLDEVTMGGFPRGRPTLVCGGAGCGKTLLAIEFLARGATEFGEPGVYISFEESIDELVQNARSIGFDLTGLIESKQVAFDHVRMEHAEIEQTGDFDLEGLFVRLEHAIQSVGAKRVVLDTIETLFTNLSDTFALRSEMRRLFRWLKDHQMTAVITAERGEGSLTRDGLEEYVSDCVILLDHRVNDQVSTRRMRVVKYRGTAHATNEFPFLIDNDGISVIPITSLGLDHPASEERVSSGIAGLDRMLDGEGYLRGTSVLVSGTAGSGKTSIAAHFAATACARGESCLFFSFEESESQLVRNMRSIGLNLQGHLDSGLLRVHATRPTRYGLEMHLAMIHKLVTDEEPDVVVIDPISAFIASGTVPEVGGMLIRIVDFLKSRDITSLFTCLQHEPGIEQSEIGVSSIIDTWISLKDREEQGCRSGTLSIVKSRGMPHSREICDFRMSSRGIEISTAAQSNQLKGE